MSPTATSPSLTPLENDGLVWRTSPSDVLQAQALNPLVAEVSAEIAATLPPPAGVRLAIVAKGDSYGKGIRDLMLPGLTVNGKPALDQPAFFQSIEYANTDDVPDYDFTPVIAKLVAFKPHILVTLGTSEVFPLLDGLEAGLAGSETKPRYLGADGVVTPEALPFLKDHPAIRPRITFTHPGDFTTPTFLNFRGRYEAKYGAGTFDPKIASLGADGAYLLALAAVASAGEPLTGASLARGLRMVTAPDGVAISLQPNEINRAFELLQTGARLKVTGASGPLDYVPGTGDPIVDIDVQIVCPDVQSNLEFRSSGRSFDVTDGHFKGTMTPCP